VRENVESVWVKKEGSDEYKDKRYLACISSGYLQALLTTASSLSMPSYPLPRIYVNAYSFNVPLTSLSPQTPRTSPSADNLRRAASFQEA
jgi:hypothetical protein